MKVRGLPVIVLLFGLALTGLLTLVCVTTHNNNEDRLLRLQVRQAASVVTEAIPSVQIPLVSASQLAQATNGDQAQFQSSLGRYVGSRGPFSSASLWNVQTSPSQPVSHIGRSIVATPSLVRAVTSATRTATLVVQGDLHSVQPSIFYADSAAPGSQWVVAAAAPLPKNRKLKVASNSAFGNIDYALYLGPDAAPANLLGSSVPVPITGRHATVTVPFGTNHVTLVGTPKGELGGSLLARLPWIVAIVGVLLSLAAAVMTYLLVNRERRAEALADESRELYAEQRNIAETLQHAILPQSLPRIRGIETAARYIAGSDEAEVGGDWYEIIALDDDHFVFALGDVSGRGVEAANLMARLSHAIEAYSIKRESPSVIMHDVATFFGTERDGVFATVICGLVDVPRHEVTLVNAGHPAPILITSEDAKPLSSVTNPPVGLAGAEFEATTVTVPRGATLVAFSDGLFEQRGEVLDIGLERLRSIATARPQTLDSLLDAMVNGTGTTRFDDTAILGIRWKS